MAPEVWLGAKPNQLSDVYDLGVLTYHLLTGYKPRKTPTEKTVLPLRNHCKSVPPDINELILRALLLKPEARPASANEMLKGLTNILLHSKCAEF